MEREKLDSEERIKGKSKREWEKERNRNGER